MHIFLMIFTFALWSSIFSLGKQTLTCAPPVFLTSARMLLAGILLLCYLFFFQRNRLKIKKNQIIPLIVLAISSIYLTNIFEFWGLQHLSAAKTCFIYSLTPFFAAFFSYLHFNEKMNFRKWIGLTIGILGMTPVFLSQSGSEQLFGGIFIFSWPELAIIGATLCSVYGWVLLRVLVKDETLSPITANGYSMFLGGIFALIHSIWIDSWMPTPIASGYVIPFLKGIFLMTLISNIICYNLYGYLLRRFTATILSFFGLLSPLFASLNEWLLLGQKPSGIIFLSTFIILLGLCIVYKEELKLGYIITKKQLTPGD